MDPFAIGLGVAGLVANIIQSQQDYKKQKDAFAYQKQLQQEIFNREDTAAQRRATDLRAAGLNQLLVGGSGAGAGSVVPVKAPERSYKIDPMSAIQIGLGMQELKKKQVDVDYKEEQITAKQIENYVNDFVKDYRKRELGGRLVTDYEEHTLRYAFALHKKKYYVKYGKPEFELLRNKVKNEIEKNKLLRGTREAIILQKRILTKIMEKQLKWADLEKVFSLGGKTGITGAALIRAISGLQ